jgi:hypothetical protein
MWRPKSIRIAVFLAGLIGFAHPSLAAEYGWGTYLPGLSIPMIGFTPPPGFYLSDSVYAYEGSAGAAKKFPFGQASISGNLKEQFLVDVPMLSWITDVKILGGNLGFSATVPFPIGTERTSADVILTGPLGNSLQAGLSKSVWGIGDMAIAGLIGWNSGENHWNVAVTGTIPTGVYDPTSIAFLGLHRPSVDVRGAYTYLSMQTGIEISAAVGITFNYINTATNYQTGDELHFEWDINEHFASGWSIGVGGFVYDQVTGDSGAGAKLGPFEGRDVAIGPLVGYTFKFMEVIPVNLNARWFHEFDVKNRVTGNSIFGTISIPLINLPPTPVAAKY